MKILVTGATGFLGSHVAEQLSAQGHQVRCLIRTSANRHFLETLPNIEFCEGQLADEGALQQAVTGIDAIIHAAGLVKARHCSEFNTINVEGTINLLKATLAKAPQLKRFVLVSSLAAVGAASDGHPLQEDTIKSFNPVTHYGRSKLTAEQQARTFADKIPITIIRPPLIYGPRDKECLAFFQAVQYKIFPFFGSKHNTASVIYGPDAANALCQAVHTAAPSGAAYFIDDGIIHTSCDMINQLAQAMGTKLWLKPVLPNGILKAAAFITEQYGKLSNSAVMLTRDKVNELIQPHWVCNSQKAQCELQWRPQVDWATGVKLTYEWYQKAGWL